MISSKDKSNDSNRKEHVDLTKDQSRDDVIHGNIFYKKLSFYAFNGRTFNIDYSSVMTIAV